MSTRGAFRSAQSPAIRCIAGSGEVGASIASLSAKRRRRIRPRRIDIFGAAHRHLKARSIPPLTPGANPFGTPKRLI
jgi:hypothetical protein